MQRAVAGGELEAHVGEPGQQVLHVLGAGVADRQLATGHGDRGQVGGGLDAVGDGAVPDGPQRAPLDPADHDLRRADPGDVGAHVDEHLAEVDDLGLAGRVLDGRDAVGEDRGGDDVLGRPDAGEPERDVGPVQPVGGGLDLAVAELELRAHRLEAGDVHVDRAGAEVVAAGHRERDPPASNPGMS